MPETDQVFDEKSAAQKTVVTSIRKQLEIAQENLLAGDYDAAAWCVDFAISQMPIEIKAKFKERLKQKISNRIGKEVPQIFEILELRTLNSIPITDEDVAKYPYLSFQQLRARIYRDKKIEKIVYSELEKYSDKIWDELDRAGLGALKDEGDQRKMVIETATLNAKVQTPLEKLQPMYPK